MTKKTEVKAKVKGADTEQKVLKKIKDGDKAAKKDKKSSTSAEKTQKHDKPVKTEKIKSDKNTSSDKKDKTEMTGKRTFVEKDGAIKKSGGKAGAASGQ